MTPIERMARAICRAEHILRLEAGPWRPGELDTRVDQYWLRHVPTACAALVALENPSKEMADAARWALFRWREAAGNPQKEAPWAEKHAIRFTAMIRAALEQGP